MSKFSMAFISFNIQNSKLGIIVTFEDRLLLVNHESTDPKSKVIFRNILLSEYGSVLTIDINAKLLAVCTSKKHALIYDLVTLNEAKCFNLQKQATAVKFCNKFNKLLVADRSGVVTEFDLSENNYSIGSPVMGHVSMILDLILSPCEYYLATCDRDEKIRVSHYPNVYNIESYCLEHTQYVRSLCWLNIRNSYVLVSSSGDGCIKFWNHKNGTLILSLDLGEQKYWWASSKPKDVKIKKIIAVESDQHHFLFAIFEESSCVTCFKLLAESVERIDCLDFHCEYTQNYILSFDVANVDGIMQILIFRKFNSLPVTLYRFDSRKKFSFVEERRNELVEFLNSTEEIRKVFLDGIADAEILPLTTKRKYNAVDEIVQPKQPKESD